MEDGYCETAQSAPKVLLRADTGGYDAQIRSCTAGTFSGGAGAGTILLAAGTGAASGPQARAGDQGALSAPGAAARRHRHAAVSPGIALSQRQARERGRSL